MDQYTSNLTNLFYVGNVKVKLKINDKIIEVSHHNKGLPGLQRAFCNFLTGNMITHEDVPEYMDVRYGTESGSSYIYPKTNTILLNKLPLTGKSWEEGRYIYQDNSEENTYIAKLTAVLSSNSLAQKIDSASTTPYRIYLLSGSNGVINDVVSGFWELAYLPISAETLGMVGPGTQAIIEWSLQLLTGSDE